MIVRADERRHVSVKRGRQHAPPDDIAHSRSRYIGQTLAQEGQHAVSGNAIAEDEIGHDLGNSLDILAGISESGIHRTLQFAVATAARNPVGENIAMVS